MPPLRGSKLQREVRRLKIGKKPGPDGWSAEELRQLPLPYYHALAQLLNRCEAIGRWPKALHVVNTVFLDKGKPPRPLDVRPIALSSEIYKLWAGARSGFVQQAVNQHTTDGVLGGKQGITVIEAVGETMVRLEVRELAGHTTLGLHSDLTRCYERIPHRLLHLIGCRYGIPTPLLKLVIMMYQFPKILSVDSLSTWARDGRCNGTLAGCRLAVQFMALLGDTLLRTLHRHTPLLAARAYVDDIVFHSGEGNKVLDEFNIAHGIYRQWIEALGFVANSKTGIWSQHGGHLAAQAYSGQFGYAVVSEVRDLGVDLCLRGAGRRPTHTTRMKRAFANCLRLQRSSGFSQVQLQLGVRLIILGKALWASELCPPSWHTMTELGQQVAKVIYKTLMGRNVELALGILATTPGLIPHHLRCMRTIAFWHRWLLSPRVPRALLEDAWQVGLKVAVKKHLWAFSGMLQTNFNGGCRL